MSAARSQTQCSDPAMMVFFDNVSSRTKVTQHLRLIVKNNLNR